MSACPPNGQRLLNGLRVQRERLGLTQGALAERVGVSRKTINTIENLVFTPSALLALKLARSVDRSFEQVFWLEGDERP